MNVGRFRSRLRAALTSAAILLPIIAGATAASPISASASGTRMVSASGTASFSNTASASDTADSQGPEILQPNNSDGATGANGATIVDRSNSAAGNGNLNADGSPAKTKSDPVLNLTVEGLYHRQQRLANGGNQFSVEPPDQGLCAGNGFVLETVNDVMKVFDYSGNTVKATTDLNSFYNYAPAIVRAHRDSNGNIVPAVFGPFVTDPSCYYDTDTQRWFHLVLTLDTNPHNGHCKGTDHLDIAVSNSSDPTGTWTIYKVNAEDDGTNGQPNHGCSFGPCFGDYPHLGADATGFYVTTNEYSFFGPEFHGAQIYAFSKRALASGAASVAMTQFDTHAAEGGRNGFTLAPATTPGGQYATGTEYFLSSNAGAEAHDTGDGTAVGTASSEIVSWSLTGTESLDSASPALTLSHSNIPVGTYVAPPPADQKVGSAPLKDCLNNAPCATSLNGQPDPFVESEQALDSSDTRMFQTTYANGKLWGALDTALNGKAGIEYFIVNPSANKVVRNGYLGLANNNLTYGAVGVTPSGRGVIGFTVLGPDHFPSAGYAGLDALSGAGAVQIAAEGAGPEDGFSDYLYYGNPPGTNRPRWGDYGATAVVGNQVWIASEYIGQTCTLAQYEGAAFGGSGAFGSCGGTRSSLANWDTRISLVTP